MSNSANPKVSTCMITYNHEKYISRAIESVLMQVTDFEIELVIGEDCSNDSTRAICENFAGQFPDKIKLMFSDKNHGMVLNFLRTLEHCQGKYIAICEGDDYWTNPFKLQKQVDFLEKNVDFGMVYTDVKIIDKYNNIIENNANNICKRYMSGWIFTALLKGNFINTCTVVFRKDLLPEGMDNAGKLWFVYDYWLWLRIAINSKIYFMNEITGAYRFLEDSVSHSPDFKDRRKSYFLFSDVLEAFGKENKKILMGKDKEILTRKLISLFFQPYGSLVHKLRQSSLITKYFPGLIGFIHILKSKYMHESSN